MRFWKLFLVGVILSSGLFYVFSNNIKSNRGVVATEAFIERWLTNDNGTLATYMKVDEVEDSDLVSGREALSESLGIWLHYSLLRDDRAQFDQAYKILNDFFLEKDGFVRWKLTETGENEVFANAFVDDLRISLALFKASEKWIDHRYEETAVQISKYLTQFNRNENRLTDYYVKNVGASRSITLSYIEPNALSRIDQKGLIDKDIYENTLAILKDAPLDGVFYPKAYDVVKGEYLYDSKINMIDQSLVALYRARGKYSTVEFLEFIKDEVRQYGVIFGQYNRISGKALVEYESPAVYGWLILYSLEINELELADTLYKRMIQFKSQDSKYVGGYSVYKDDTHIFDNLVPLLAETEMEKLKIE